jgi:ribosomal protein S27AE
MQHVIICAQCREVQFGTVEQAINLELMCPKCRCTTIVNTHGDRLSTRIGRMPEHLLRQLMRSGGVDERKCR